MPFAPGQSGNPSGRPKENPEVRDLARVHTARAIERLSQIMESADERAAAAASSSLLDRGWGRPAQAVNLGDSEGNALRLLLVNTSDKS